jgi:glycosyltransferase involved in cell wall biosynthesis
MLHWKLAMRFGESAENIFKVIPFLLKPAMRLLGGGAAESAAPKKSLSPIFDALMEAPFAEREKRIVAGMRARASELQAGYAERPQSELVSVIMPTYNRAELMQRALRSLINQSYSNWEVIVVDDGGNDNTAEAVKMLGDNRIRYIRHNKRRGVSAARNSGLEQARGSCIAYLDSDNEWEPDYLLLMVNYLADHSGMRAVYCAQAMYTEEKGEDKPLLTGIRFAEFQYSILVHRNYIDLNVFMHHRSLYDRYGGFDESLRRLVDWDLFIRYMRHAVPLALPCILTRYHQVRSAKRITDREGYWKNIKKLQALHSVHRLNLQNYPAGVNPADMYSLPSAEHSAEIRRKVSIVIPSYGVLDCLKTCVEAIQKFTPPEAYELVIFDNASDADVREYLCGLDAKGLAKIQLCDQNMGFTFAVNEGIRLSEPGNDIVLMNNDAIVTEGWLEEFAAVTDAMPDAGLLAPQQVLLPFTHTMKTHVPYCLPFREVDVTISAHHDNLINPRLMPEKAYQELSFVNFFCVYITRECLDDTGLLNEEDGRHYKSDRLFCEKMLNRGRFKIVYTPYCKIYHLLQQSTIDLKKKNVKEYKTMFVKNEWSGDAERLRRTLRSGTDNAQNPSPQK